MKIFHKGKLISPYGKGKKMEGRAKSNRRLIAQYKFDNTLYDLIPEFNDGFIYDYKDIIDGEVTIRTIYSDSLPTTVRFGARTTSNRALSLLEVDYLNTSNVTDMSYMFGYCYSLTQLDLSNWNTSKVTDMYGMFDEAAINKIIMNNSNYNSVNKIIAELPIRTSDSINALDIIGVDDISQVDTTTLNSKYWTIISHTVLNNARLGQTKLN